MKRKEVLVHVSPRLARWLVALRMERFSKMGKNRTAKTAPEAPQTEANRASM